MAMTGNSDINKMPSTSLESILVKMALSELISSDEMDDPENNPKEGLFSQTDDYIKLTEVCRKYPKSTKWSSIQRSTMKAL